MEEEPRAGGAGLALTREAHGGDDAVGGAVAVSVGKQDLRTLSAELERDRDDPIGREAKDLLTCLGIPGEGDLSDEGVLRERRSDLTSRPRDDVEDSLRKVRLTDLRELEHREWRVRRRLEHHRVPREERRRDLPCGNEDGDVPRDDRCDDPERLTSRVREHLLAEWDGLALELTAEPAEVAEHVRDGLRLRPRLCADGVPGLPREGAREVLDASLDVVGDARECASAVARCDRAPRRKRRGGGPDSTVDVGGAGARYVRDDPASRRGCLHVERTAVCALDPLAADEHARAEHILRGVRDRRHGFTMSSYMSGRRSR